MVRKFLVSCCVWVFLAGCASINWGIPNNFNIQDSFDENSEFGLGVVSIEVTENAQKAFFIEAYNKKKSSVEIQWRGTDGRLTAKTFVLDNVKIVDKEGSSPSEIFLKLNKSEVKDSLVLQNPTKTLFFIVKKFTQYDFYQLSKIQAYYRDSSLIGGTTEYTPQILNEKEANEKGCSFKNQKGQLQYLGNLVLDADDPYIETITAEERNSLFNKYGDADTYRLVRPFLKAEKPLLTSDKLEESKSYVRKNYPNISPKKIDEMQYVTTCNVAQ